MGPNHLQGKKKFSVPSSSKDTSKCINGQINRSKYGETGVPCALDAIFEQYKNTMKGNQDVSAPNDSGEVSVSITDDVEHQGKEALLKFLCSEKVFSVSKCYMFLHLVHSQEVINEFMLFSPDSFFFNGFLGSSGTLSARKVLAVLGEGSAANPRRKLRMLDNIEKPNTLFNHYANGGGWWDCNMEGVDNEEVGYSELKEIRDYVDSSEDIAKRSVSGDSEECEGCGSNSDDGDNDSLSVPYLLRFDEGCRHKTDSNDRFFDKYPWGKETFQLTMDYLKKKTDLKKQKEVFDEKQKASYTLFGFPWAFMIGQDLKLESKIFTKSRPIVDCHITKSLFMSHEDQTLVVGTQALVDPLDDKIDSPRENDLCPSVHDIFNGDKEGLLNFEDDTLGENESGRDLSPWLRLPFDPDNFLGCEGWIVVDHKYGLSPLMYASCGAALVQRLRESKDVEDSEGRSEEESESDRKKDEIRRDSGDGEEEDPQSLPICVRDIFVESYNLTTWMDHRGYFPAKISIRARMTVYREFRRILVEHKLYSDFKKTSFA
ncbi:putative GDSL esterase/lipase-like [Capsicum annuum]|nr:putative GDSL esterase/lipase-like [Capsicum annuum]KAF3647295.1 putative GDSL esterase/lipase-like [Capsicum annuum]